MGKPAFQFTIRRYQPGDAAPMARLYFESARQLGPRRYSREQVEAWAPEPSDPAAVHARASDGRLTLVATDARGDVIGYGDLEADGHIDHLYCRPDAASRGVAGAILDGLVAQAASRGAPPRLHVEASELARGLFERKGFVVVTRRDFEVRGVPIHNYAMELILPRDRLKNETAVARSPGSAGRRLP
jgi:putative acetyltransferase